MKRGRTVVLASASPRRADLLRQMGLEFEVVATHIPEPPPEGGEDLIRWARDAAARKARAAAAGRVGPEVILGADTVVAVEDRGEERPAARLRGTAVKVLGKPGDAERAREMLRMLSGRTHSVVTAFALLRVPEGTLTVEHAETRVTFRTLTEDEIEEYVETGEPLDKAGGYGIQGRGAVLVERIAGDYGTVVGLPMAKVWEALWRDGD